MVTAAFVERHDAVAHEYVGYVFSDPTLSNAQKARRVEGIAEWRRLVEQQRAWLLERGYPVQRSNPHPYTLGVPGDPDGFGGSL